MNREQTKPLDETGSLLIKTLIFLMLIPGTVTVLIPYFILRHLPILTSTQTGPFYIFSIALIFFGAALCFWSFWSFIAIGRGTPAPIDPPKRLVIKGPYRYVGNPMYIGILLIILGEAILFYSMPMIVYLISLFLVFFLFVIGYEEPNLKLAFGEEYEQYRSSVPRWLIRFK